MRKVKASLLLCACVSGYSFKQEGELDPRCEKLCQFFKKEKKLTSGYPLERKGERREERGERRVERGVRREERERGERER